MIDMSWTSDDVTALRAAVASGVLSVSYDGPPKRMITYHSLAEMRSLLADMIADVGDAAGTRASYRFGATSKGFDT